MADLTNVIIDDPLLKAFDEPHVVFGRRCAGKTRAQIRLAREFARARGEVTVVLLFGLTGPRKIVLGPDGRRIK